MINKILCKIWGHGKAYEIIGPNSPFQPSKFNEVYTCCIHCDDILSVWIPKGFTFDGEGINEYFETLRSD